MKKLVIVIGALLIAPASAQTVLLELGPHNGEYGRTACGLGDVDGDGVADYAAGAPYAKVGGAPFAGKVRAHSGADGKVLWLAAHPRANEIFGSRLARIGDVNGDGADDVAVGGDNVFQVLSGVAGSLIHDVPTAGAFGLDDVGDLDGDGVDDFAVGGAPLRYNYL